MSAASTHPANSNPNSNNSLQLQPIELTTSQALIEMALGKESGKIKNLPGLMQKHLKNNGHLFTQLKLIHCEFEPDDLTDLARTFPNLKVLHLLQSSLSEKPIRERNLRAILEFFPKHNGLRLACGAAYVRDPQFLCERTVDDFLPEQLVFSQLLKANADLRKIESGMFAKVQAVAHTLLTIDVSGLDLTKEKVLNLSRMFIKMQRLVATGCTFDGNKSFDPAEVERLLLPKKVVVVVQKPVPVTAVATTVITSAAASATTTMATTMSSLGEALGALTITAVPITAASTPAAASMKKKKVKKKSPQQTASVPTPIKKVSPNTKRFLAALGKKVPDKNAIAVDLRRVDVSAISDWAEIVCTQFPEAHFVQLPFKAKLTSDAGRILQKGLKNLLSLDISYCDKSDLRGLEHLPHLQQLHNIRPYDDEQRVFLKPDEEAIQVAFNNDALLKITTEDDVLLDRFDPKGMEFIANMRDLRILRFGSVHTIGDRALSPFIRLARLEEFSLSSTAVGVAGIRSLRSSKETLKRLILTNCAKLDDKAMKEIADTFTQLTELRLTGCDVNTTPFFTALARMKNLRTLLAGGFLDIAPSAWNRLSESCPLLEQLCVRDAGPITDATFLSWTQMRQLKFCRLFGSLQNPITQTAVSEFEKKMPDGGYVQMVRSEPVGVASAFSANSVTVDFKNGAYSNGPLSAHIYSKPADGKTSTPFQYMGTVTTTKVSVVPKAVVLQKSEYTADEIAYLGKNEIRAQAKIVSTVVSYLMGTFPLYYAKEKEDVSTRVLDAFPFLQNAHVLFGEAEGATPYMRLFANALENVLPKCVSLTINPSEVQMVRSLYPTLDLRGMPVDNTVVTRLSAMRDVYPDVEFLHLPAHLPLNQHVGQELAKFQHLRALDISFCAAADMVAFQYLPNIREIYNRIAYEKSDWYFENGVPKIDPRTMPEGWEKLSQPGLTDEQAQWFAYLPHLEVLHFGPSTMLSVRTIDALKVLKKLKNIGIVGCPNFADGTLRRLSENFVELEELACAGNSISDTGLGYLAQMKKLHTLIIGDQPNITKAGVKHIGKCNGLRRLLIAKQKAVTDGALISVLRDLKDSLQVLSVENTDKLSDDVLKMFQKELPKCRLLVGGKPHTF